ncbi:MAG: macro domain-containing protein [Anaerolineales bacterium]|nr:macro domain-containing protein [Anaerolineales bacterium]
MILYVEGNLFNSPAQVLVNTVNTVGVMGKGVALEFKRLFPDMYKQYRILCEQESFNIGMLWLYRSPNKWVLNFPTKKHWRNPSKIEYVEAGLKKFVDTYVEMGIHSIAFPPLGCGNGQLDFKTQVQPLMHEYLRYLPIDVFIYPDKESSFVEHLSPAEMKKWLRTEPTSLPFLEVWDDLSHLLKAKSSFTTIAQNNEFTAQICDDPEGIEISASGQRYLVKYEDLVSFWQQLRNHGFSTRRIAPGINKQISYLIPIFSELDYVKPVHVTEKYEQLTKATSSIGLQVLPSAFSRSYHAEQLPLISLENI